MMRSSMFRLEQVRKQHGPGFSLNIDELDIVRGDTLVLLGPTGSGKTSLLRLLAGLDSPTCGTIHCDGQRLEIANLPLALRRRMAMVHQRSQLLTGSVRYNIEYGLHLRRASPARRVDDIVNRLGLADVYAQAARSLSGGETQLVALARALVLAPEVLLLDEPTAHLDPARVGLVEETLQAVQSERATTVVWATHNLFQARRVASRVALLWNGRLVEAANTEEFFERPADSRTADFVHGKMVY